MTDGPDSDTPSSSAYLRARDAVLRLKARRGEPARRASPSAYWTEELENIDYMIEASPLIVRKLRHHAFHITGIRPYDYRHKGDGRREYFEARLTALRGAAAATTLLVPESPALGGFGYPIDGQLLQRRHAEVLRGAHRHGARRRADGAPRASIGRSSARSAPGWGGFAYQFKTLFPRATYVIVDFPELFLFSATYLGTLLPGGAACAFVGTETRRAAGGLARRRLRVRAAHAGRTGVAPLPLDLTVNMVSFQEMTDAQVRGYAAHGGRGGLPAALQPEPRALAVQHASSSA